MKYSRHTLVALLSLFLIRTEAQPVFGIYLNGNDFSNSKLYNAISGNKKCKLKSHEFPYKNFIILKCGGTASKFYKDSIFGYKDLNDINYRFFGKVIYTILNPGEQILLYKTETIISGAKNTVIINNYFFSKDANSKVSYLTINNLLDAFKNNILFCEWIEIHFKNDSDLIEYDSTHNIYKLNRLLQLSNSSK